MQGGLVLAARRVRSKEEKTNKKNEKNPPHRNHTTKPASAQRPQTTSRQLTTKRVPRVSPYSPASIDPGFVEIGLACIHTRCIFIRSRNAATAEPLVHVVVLYSLAIAGSFSTGGICVSNFRVVRWCLTLSFP